MKESEIEKKCRLWLESKGGRLFKIRNMSRAGWPDRMLFCPRSFKGTGPAGSAPSLTSVNTSTGFCELKQPGKTPDPHQQLVMDEMRALGVWVFWTDSFEGFKREVECYLSQTSNPTS